VLTIGRTLGNSWVEEQRVIFSASTARTLAARLLELGSPHVVLNTENEDGDEDGEVLGEYMGREEDTVRYLAADNSIRHAPDDCVRVEQRRFELVEEGEFEREVAEAIREAWSDYAEADKSRRSFQAKRLKELADELRVRSARAARRIDSSPSGVVSKKLRRQMEARRDALDEAARLVDEQSKWFRQ
jgi:hypothetical protein